MSFRIFFIVGRFWLTFLYFRRARNLSKSPIKEDPAEIFARQLYRTLTHAKSVGDTDRLLG